MRLATIPALLLPAMLAALPAMAQTTSWSGASLVFTGGGTNGCAIGLTSATHAGGPASQIRLIFANNGTDSVRVTGDAVLTQGGQSTNRQFSVAMNPGIAAFTPGPNPGAVQVSGSTLRVTITGCQQR